MEFLVLWFLFGLVAALIASYRGRSGCTWSLLGALIGPFALVVAVLPSTEQKLQQQARAHGSAPGYRKCPYCGEAIRAEAIKCRYCQSDLHATPATAPSQGDTPPVPDDYTFSFSEAAQAIGVTPAMLEGYRKAGRCSLNADGTIDAGALRRAGFIIRHVPPRQG